MAALSYVGATVLVCVVFTVPVGIFMCDEVRNRWICAAVTAVALLVGMWWLAAVVDAHDKGSCNAGQPPAIECVW